MFGQKSSFESKNGFVKVLLCTQNDWLSKTVENKVCFATKSFEQKPCIGSKIL